MLQANDLRSSLVGCQAHVLELEHRLRDLSLETETLAERHRLELEGLTLQNTSLEASQTIKMAELDAMCGEISSKY